MPTDKVDRYLITHEYTCPECDGEGYWHNDLYEGANKAWDQAIAANTHIEYPDAVDIAAKAMDTYWRNLGYNPRKPPPEEEPCEHCGSTGITRESVELAEALRRIGN